jgi:hypothetical protein
MPGTLSSMSIYVEPVDRVLVDHTNRPCISRSSHCTGPLALRQDTLT